MLWLILINENEDETFLQNFFAFFLFNSGGGKTGSIKEPSLGFERANARLEIQGL